ncbi:MAG: phosphatase PAP2 family protein [Deltaproteobacteria bacterium]|nr:phosphatase PAP2 family protein [Deltaproteobacteria bacterium]
MKLIAPHLKRFLSLLGITLLLPLSALGMEAEITETMDDLSWISSGEPFFQPTFLKASPKIPFREADFDTGLGTVQTLSYDAFYLVTLPLHSPTTTGLFVTGVGALAGGTTQADQDIKYWVQENSNESVHEMSAAFKVFGEKYVTLGAFLLPMTYGIAAGHRHTRDLGITALEAGVYSALITEGLKDTFDRERPRASDDGAFFTEGASFPSGHATAAFSLASVYSVYYSDQIWVSFLAYSIASGVAFSRMEYNAHWASDVIAGAAVGTFVGRTLANLHLGNKKPLFLPGLQFTMLGPNTFGLQLKF